MKSKFIPVILAGGKGERFWPLSRRQRPKQFLCLDGTGISLLQATANRLLPLVDGWDNLMVITSALVAENVRQQLPLLPSENILVEPEGKDTAPAVTWASLEIQRRFGGSAIAGFFPADHWINSPEGFIKTILAGIEFAKSQRAIVTLGITPNYPSTGYGYIQQGDKEEEINNLPVYKVTRFTEKPDQETASKFIATGDYSWNSGMFIFEVDFVLQELAKFAPEIFKPLQEKGAQGYLELEKISIDYALMEKTASAYVLPADFPWDDLGDWNALERLLSKTDENITNTDSINYQTKNSIIYSTEENEIIITIGLEDVVIVRDGNATLIVNKHQTQDIKKALKLLQTKDNSQDFL
ncbi:MAG: mannose-1-phosphate guanylyltransferase [Cyanobacterium sp.]